MATQVSTGAVLRKGANKLTGAELLTLVDNKSQVDRIIKEIDARRAVYQKTVLDAQEREAAAERAEKALAEHDATLVERETALEAATAEAAAKHRADMEALERRTREVVDNEAAADARTKALDAREQEIEDQGRTRETELAAREEEFKRTEDILEAKHMAAMNQSIDLNARQARLETAAKIVKQAVASLG